MTAEQDAQRRGDLLQGRVHDDYFSSTWQSVARGHSQVETDWFNGEIVLQARLHGRQAPVNELIQRVTAEHARVGRPVRSPGCRGGTRQARGRFQHARRRVGLTHQACARPHRVPSPM